MSNFTQRLLTGIAFIIVLIGCIWFSASSFNLLFYLIAVLGLNEFYSIAKLSGARPSIIPSMIIGWMLYSVVTHYFVQREITPMSLVIFIAPFLLFINELYRKSSTPFQNISWSLIGIFYVILPFALLTYIAYDHGGYDPYILIGIFFMIWASDTGAYLAGRQFGRHKLFESISPKKTWEGAIGGGVLSLGVAYGNSQWFGIFTPVQWLILGSIVVVFGNLGDLVESMLKRSLNIKDSGTLLPGHGGILDRFDSLIMSAPFLAIAIYLFRHYLII